MRGSPFGVTRIVRPRVLRNDKRAILTAAAPAEPPVIFLQFLHWKAEVKLGRKPKLAAAQVTHVRQLTDGGENGRTVTRSCGVARSTLYEALKAAR